MSRVTYPALLIALAALTRLMPHPANMTPITAIALFGAVALDRRWAFVVPIVAMVISDAILGFHSTMPWVYASFLAIVGLGFWVKRKTSVPKLMSATLAGSVIFFVVTNFGAWMSGMMMYPMTFGGLVECYVAAIPFFRNTLLGDLVFTGVVFGAFEIMRMTIPSLRTAPSMVQE